MRSKQNYIMKSDVKEKKDAYILEIDLPGFRKEDIQVYMKNAFLVVSASQSEEQEKHRGKFLHRERYSGTYQREFYVGYGIPEESIKAVYRHGVLKITIPKDTLEKHSDKGNIVIA